MSLRTWSKSRAALAAVGAVAALSLTACGGGNGPSAAAGSATPQVVNTQTSSIGKNAHGPAKEVPGAVKGGTMHMLVTADFDHIDPQRAYVNVNQLVGQLLYRPLTTFVGDGKGGLTLVGDAATDTGTTTDGGKTWKFTLRDGLKWQDGSPVTSKDVKYGIERAFSDQITDGPAYIQEWLAGTPDFSKVYNGPFDGKQLDAIQTPDDKTIIFKLKAPHQDFPYAASLTTTVAVPQSKDTKSDYDNKVWSFGPYKIDSYQRGQQLTLVRNDQWDPKTDPIRNAYPDKFVFDMGIDSQVINERLIADQGDDQTAATWGSSASVPSALIPRVMSDASAKARSQQYLTQYTEYYNINMSRVTDLNERKALLYAFNKQSYRLTLGGSTYGDYATTLSSPTTPGWKNYDVFNVPPTGDVEKAKEFLAKSGNPHPTIVLGHQDTQRSTNAALAIRGALEKAGFVVQLKPIPKDSYYSTIGKVDNGYDLYRTGWGSDWPGYTTIVPPLWDGRKIADGAANYSHLNDPKINAAIDRALATPAEQQNAAFLDVEKQIMQEVPAIPTVDIKSFVLHGSKVGNAHPNDAFGDLSLTDIYVKQ